MSKATKTLPNHPDKRVVNATAELSELLTRWKRAKHRSEIRYNAAALHPAAPNPWRMDPASPAFRKALNRAYRRSGYTAAKREWDKLDTSLMRRWRAVEKMRPTTPRGARAKARICLAMVRAGMFEIEDVRDSILPAIVADLSGLPRAGLKL